MADIRLLRDTRANLMRESDSIYAAADAAGSWSDEQESRYEAIGTELENTQRAITREETNMERQRGRDLAPAAALPSGNVVDGVNGGGYKSFGEQLVSIMLAETTRQVDPRLIGVRGNGQTIVAGATGMSESIGPDGGFLVQTDFVTDLLQNLWDNSEIMSRIRRITVGANSNGIVMNGIDENSRANGSRWGGVQSFWTAEAGLKTPSQPRFKKIKMELDKLAMLVYATDELMDDTSALEQYLNTVAQDEMDFRCEDAVIAGTGAGMPLGILNSPALITVAKETSQATSSLLSQNIVKMWSRLPPRSRGNAVWLVNSDIEPLLYTLFLAIKNVAGTENVGGIATPVTFLPAGANNNEFGMLMGRPVIPVEYCSALNTPGDIILADLSQYLGIDKGGIQAASSIHVRFINDEQVWRFVYRFNGQPIWQLPITPYRGSTSMSPFVVLGAR